MSRKVVLIGDGSAGNTHAISAFLNDIFLNEYNIPAVIEEYVADIQIDGMLIELHLWDTAGREDYDRLRPLYYPHSDAVIVGYDVSWPDSLANVEEKWVPEITHFIPKVPFVLVGHKIDLRNNLSVIKKLEENKKQKIVTSDEGRAMAEKVGAWCYMECSSLTREGLREVFENATRAALGKLKNSSKSIASEREEATFFNLASHIQFLLMMII